MKENIMKFQRFSTNSYFKAQTNKIAAIRVCTKIFCIAVLTLIVLCMPSDAQAATIDIVPDSIRSDNLLVGGYNQIMISIKTDSREGFVITPSANGSISEWISFSPNKSLEVSNTSPLLLEVLIKPPKTMAEGLYLSNIILDFKKKVPSLFFNREIKSIDLLTNLTHKRISDVKVENIDTYDTKKGSLIDITVNMTNNGNIQEDIAINILTDNKIIPNVIRLNPGENAEKIINIDTTGMQTGNKKISVDVIVSGDIIYSKDYTIVIKEEDSIYPEMELLSLEYPSVAYENEVLQIISYLENTGESSTYAVLRTEVIKDKKIIETIESRSVYVPKGRIRTAELSFSPTKQGEYILESSVYYEDKRTKSKDMIIEVLPESMKIQPLRFTVYPLLMILLIITLVLTVRYMTKKWQKIKK